MGATPFPFVRKKSQELVNIPFASRQFWELYLDFSEHKGHAYERTVVTLFCPDCQAVRVMTGTLPEETF